MYSDKYSARLSVPIRRICVFCGARSGSHPDFAIVASDLGRLAARSGMSLVYAGGGVALMGIVARAALQEGGEVTGIIPRFLMENEEALAMDHHLIVVDDMVTRKQEMAARADAFVVLPGGFGTLEEVAEQISWAKLDRHSKPIVLIDTSNYWRPLMTLFAQMAEMGFSDSAAPEGLTVAADAAEAIALLSGARRRATLAAAKAPPALLNEIAPEARHEVFYCPDGAQEQGKGGQP